MQMRRYIASDMRQALRQIREQLGSEAVIISSRRVADNVEVVAAVDREISEAVAAQPAPVQPAAAPRENAPAPAKPAKPAESARESVPPVARDGAVDDMNAELRQLRHMLETQVATLAWNDLTRRAPLQAQILKSLTEIGLSRELAAEIVSELPPHLELEQAQDRAHALVARRICVAEERWIDKGGSVALVGPTGAGKTTVIAKLAAHWVMRYGARDLALISCDAVRLGAPEQMHQLGRLLGVPAYAVATSGELTEILATVKGKRCVLIDTAGTNPRDPQLEAKLSALLAAAPGVETSLVLAASSQAGVLDEALQRFAPARPASCVLTKLDEAASLGGVMSLLIRTRLAVAYLSEGQRIPEDLVPGRAPALVVRALALARASNSVADEELLQRRFGGVAHVFA
jgi:flagellar biosynthesis protein FlhF